MLTYMIILLLSDFRERGNQPTCGFRTKTESRGLRGGMTNCSTIFFVLVFLGGRDSRLSSHRDCFLTAAPNNRKKKSLCFPNVFTYLVSVNSLHLLDQMFVVNHTQQSPLSAFWQSVNVDELLVQK